MAKKTEVVNCSFCFQAFLLSSRLEPTPQFSIDEAQKPTKSLY